MEIFPDLVVDLPKSPKFMGLILGGLVAKNHLSLSALTTLLEPLISGNIAVQVRQRH